MALPLPAPLCTTTLCSWPENAATPEGCDGDPILVIFDFCGNTDQHGNILSHGGTLEALCGSGFLMHLG